MVFIINMLTNKKESLKEARTEIKMETRKRKDSRRRPLIRVMYKLTI